jgi:hypothetical protein
MRQLNTEESIILSSFFMWFVSSQTSFGNPKILHKWQHVKPFQLNINYKEDIILIISCFGLPKKMETKAITLYRNFTRIKKILVAQYYAHMPTRDYRLKSWSWVAIKITSTSTELHGWSICCFLLHQESNNNKKNKKLVYQDDSYETQGNTIISCQQQK